MSGKTQRELQLDRFRKSREKYPPELLNLLVRLQELALDGDFSFARAAELVVPGEGPTLHHKDPATGKFVVTKQRVSEQMKPRDGLKPPCTELVDAIVELYLQRTGADPKPLRRELNALYLIADQHYRTTKKQREAAALETGHRAPTFAQLKEKDREIGRLQTEVAELEHNLAEVREQKAALHRTHQQHDSRTAELEQETAALRRQLDTATLRLDQLHTEREQLRAQLEQARSAAIRVTAENDQLHALVEELQAVHDPVQVRPYPVADSSPPDVTSNDEPGSTAYSFKPVLGRGNGIRFERSPIRDPSDILFPHETRAANKPRWRLSLLLLILVIALLLTSVLAAVAPLLGWIVGAFCVLGLLSVIAADRERYVERVRGRAVEVARQVLTLRSPTSTRHHPWSGISKIEMIQEPEHLGMALYTPDGRQLDCSTAAIHHTDWEDFAGAVQQAAPHITIDNLPPTEPENAAERF